MLALAVLLLGCVALAGGEEGGGAGGHAGCPAPCADASNGRHNREAASPTPLDEYVGRVDEHFSWEDTGVVHTGGLPLARWRAHVLRLTSQKWLSENDTSCPLWQHHLAIVVPRRLRFRGTVFLLIEGGNNLQGPPDDKNEKLHLVGAIATLTHSLTAVLYQVPNQPCQFLGEHPPRDRYEDDLIAYSWRHFLDHPSEHDRILRLPMTRAVVRAMDTIEAYAALTLSADVSSFVVSGASKRGWTAWLAAAVDNRVVAVVPIVMDLLNFYPNIHHIYRSLGGWPYVFRPYYALGLTRDLELPAHHKLMEIIDPYRYRGRLGMPKLVVTTSNDEFFPIDDSRFFLEELPPETHLLILPNAEHTLVTGLPTMVRSIAAFYASILDSLDTPMPLGPLPPPCFDPPLSIDPLTLTLTDAADILTPRGPPPSPLRLPIPPEGRGNSSHFDAAWGVLLDASTTMGEKWRLLLEGVLEEYGGGDPGGGDEPGGVSARARPRYRVEVDRGGGKITLLATDKPEVVKMWSATTPKGSNRRDFRFAKRDDGNCSTLHVAKGCLQPIVFEEKTLKPLSHVHEFWRYEASVPPPLAGFAAFFVEMQFKSLEFIRPPFVFTTQALIVPDTYPFPDCGGGGALEPTCVGTLV